MVPACQGCHGKEAVKRVSVLLLLLLKCTDYIDTVVAPLQWYCTLTRVMWAQNVIRSGGHLILYVCEGFVWH